MAYWLGFLFADGCVHKKAASYSVELNLKCIDYSHVEKYKTALASTYQLGLYKNLESCKAVHYIYDNVLATDLIDLGCIPRKSLQLKWPQNIPEQYTHHFVRGYCDGDGCIHFVKRKGSFSLHIAGSDAFIGDLQIYIQQSVLYPSKVKGNKHIRNNSNGFSELSYHGSTSVMTILNWMYKDSVDAIRLDRKYMLYRKFREIADLTPKQRK
eukprot:238394_1